MKKSALILIFWGFKVWAVFAPPHQAPIVIPASKIPPAQYHAISMYRLFRTAKDGTATSIPFQIDERDVYGDFILSKAQEQQSGGGIFDHEDELSFMGQDAGFPYPPSIWPMKKPSVLYEILLTKNNKKYAVYLGVYFDDPPPLSRKCYVDFLPKQGEVFSSKYHYHFEKKNYLVVKDVQMELSSGSKSIIDGSAFSLKADIKYFFTLFVNQDQIKSELAAYKVGPVRTIARVNFSYKFLAMNFDLGMYTEMSFFSNAIVLPAIIDNPMNGSRSFNKGSFFYYGFSLEEDVKKPKIQTNMPFYSQEKSSSPPLDQYYLEAFGDFYMVYFEIQPSNIMKKDGRPPMFYQEPLRTPRDPKAIDLAVAFDLLSFPHGEHDIKFKLFVENISSPEILKGLKEAESWSITAKRVNKS